MEAGDSGTRQSTSSIYGTNHFGEERDYHITRRQYSGESSSTVNMATAALISPNTPYYPHHPTSFSATGYRSGQTPPSTSGMISPVDSRRTSDDHDVAHRQSLPSIQEVIGKGAPSSYAASASSTTPMPSQGLPSPFTATAPPRPFAAENASDRQASPRNLSYASSSSAMFHMRHDPMASFSTHTPQLTGRPQAIGAQPSPSPSIDTQPMAMPSLAPSHQHQEQHQPQAPQQVVPAHLQPQRPQPDRQVQQPEHYLQHHAYRESNTRQNESPLHLNTYAAHSTSLHSTFSSQVSPQQQLPIPSSHLSLSGPYPVSPHHSGPSSLPSPFEGRQQTPLQENSPEYNRPRTKYDQAVNKHFEAWSYAECLARIGATARTIYNFADAFGSIAREEHSPQPIPARMPSDREVNDMINNAEWLKKMLDNLRSIVQETIINDRNANRQKSSNYDELDVSMYNDAMAKPYALNNEVKKRRARAAPPGRCHSCNRIDTPEWRRGPDGARTLCNACGLHYAKLERKKQLENRALRPKHPDDRL